LTDDSPGQVLRLDDNHAGWTDHHMVDVTASGDRQVVDDDMVRLELSERIRDDLLAGRARVPPRRFGFCRVAPSYQPTDADKQSDRERPFNSIEYRKPVELALFD